MKKRLSMVAGIMFLLTNIAYSQADHWAIFPNSQLYTPSTTGYSAISDQNSFSNFRHLAHAVHDPSGNLLFSVNELGMYDPAGQSFSSFEETHTEIEII